MNMPKKPYTLGVLVGRFQGLHAGHADMIAKAIELCETVGVFVGSAQESGTSKNPFSYETRRELLITLFGGKIQVYPLADIGVGNNATWGNYVLENIRKHFGRTPDLLISGKEARRQAWFDSAEGLSAAELYVPKSIDISASTMREWFIQDEREKWQAYTDPLLWEKYDELRAQVLAAKDTHTTASL